MLSFSHCQKLFVIVCNAFGENFSNLILAKKKKKKIIIWREGAAKLVEVATKRGVEMAKERMRK